MADAFADVFKDQPYLITGAASGIGLATARALAARGARLALWDRNADAVEAVADDLKAVTFRACDVSLTDVVPRHWAATLDKLGGLRGVVHSAGVLRTGLFDALDPHQHRAIVEVNLIGTINVAHAAMPALRASRGSLILLGSTSGFYGCPEYSTYGATKAAILNLAQTLQIEAAPHGVHIGVANPLFVNTPMIAETGGRSRLLEQASPFNHTYQPEQVAAALLKGIERREFMIWVGRRPRLVYLLTRYADFLSGRLMARTWRG